MLSRVERRLATDRELRAKVLFWFWVVSTGVLLLGVAIIAWRALVPR